MFGLGPIELLLICTIAVFVCAAPLAIVAMLILAFLRKGEPPRDRDERTP